MSSTEFRPEAREDLNDIWEFIAKDSPTATTNWIDFIETKHQTISEHPEMGRVRNDLEPGLHIFPVGKYAICYRPIPNDIEVMRVLHFSHLTEALFDTP